MSRERAARTLRSAWLWRLLHRLLPLGQRYNTLMRLFIAPRGFIAVPWGAHHLSLDAAWLRLASSASAPIYRDPRRQNPEFFTLLAPMLRAARQGCFVDVGANMGVYTLDARAVSARPIIAFEPDPTTFALLSRNVVANALPDIMLRPVACGDRKGALEFNNGINGAVADIGDRRVIEVAVARLDDEVQAHDVAVIKIDCEGYEWQVLNGCLGTIVAQRPMLFVELHPALLGRYGHSPAGVCDLLRPHYRLQFWTWAAEPRLRLLRLLSRYREGLVRLPDEAAMLALASGETAPEQIFVCAYPRDGAR